MHEGHEYGTHSHGHDEGHEHGHHHGEIHVHADELNHNHDHHHDHDHTHGHDEAHGGHHHHAHRHEEGGVSKNVALLTYMLAHNKEHTSELSHVADKLESEGNTPAASALREACDNFALGNDKLALALKLSGGEG